MSRVVSASRFKATCLSLLDEVAESGEEVIVTKRGTPVARLVPLSPPESLKGSVKYLVSDEEFIAPLYEDWDPEFP